MRSLYWRWSEVIRAFSVDVVVSPRFDSWGVYGTLAYREIGTVPHDSPMTDHVCLV